MWVHLNWAVGESTRRKIRMHWALFHKIWRSFVIVAEHALEVGARVFVEWPRGCSYWREPCVAEFLIKPGFKFADFDECMYGLIAQGGRGDGMPIKKPWRVACSPNSSLPQYLYKKCDGSHQHVHCAGSYTLKTQGYTPEVVKQVHVSLNADMNPKTNYTRWESGSFVCVEVPTADIDLDCFDVVAGADNNSNEVATPAPCAAPGLSSA